MRIYQVLFVVAVVCTKAQEQTAYFPPESSNSACDDRDRGLSDVGNTEACRRYSSMTGREPFIAQFEDLVGTNILMRLDLIFKLFLNSSLQSM